MGLIVGAYHRRAVAATPLGTARSWASYDEVMALGDIGREDVLAGPRASRVVSKRVVPVPTRLGFPFHETGLRRAWQPFSYVRYRRRGGELLLGRSFCHAGVRAVTQSAVIAVQTWCAILGLNQ
jgi:hypothetical protein